MASRVLSLCCASRVHSIILFFSFVNKVSKPKVKYTAPQVELV